MTSMVACGTKFLKFMGGGSPVLIRWGYGKKLPIFEHIEIIKSKPKPEIVNNKQQKLCLMVRQKKSTKLKFLPHQPIYQIGCIYNSMRRVSREENLQSDRSSKYSKQSKNDYEQIDKVLNQMQLTYKANIQAQETYIDILKRKNKNINSNYIKMIYALFTENKANQICFQKQEAMLLNSDVQDRIMRRYYARMIEMGIRKITYFWANITYLEFLSPYIVKLTRQIHNTFNDIQKIKTLDQHFTVLKMLFHENSAIQQKIYELLIDEGYIFSMDQFYRINGVDLVGDRQYEGKTGKNQIASAQPSEELIQSKKQSMKSIKLNKFKIGKDKQNKKQWGYLRAGTPDTTTYPQTEKNKTKIKTMLESMVKELKTTIQQEKNACQLEVIQQQNDINPKSQRKFEEEEKEQVKSNIFKTKKRSSKPEIQYKKRINQKKMSIQLMSYFSNEFKSAISEAPEVGIDYLSQILMTSESNSKPMEKVLLRLNNNSQSPCIHSLKSLDSLKRIKQQRKRGKLIELVLKKNNAQNVSQMYDEVNENYDFDNPISHGHKFSFRSAPGVYISLPKKQRDSQFMKLSDKSSKKSPIINNNNNRVIIKHRFPKDHIFQNEIIVNQLAQQQKQNINQKINFTEVNGNNLNVGIISLNAWPSLMKNRSAFFNLTENKLLYNQLQCGRTKKTESIDKLSPIFEQQFEKQKIANSNGQKQNNVRMMRKTVLETSKIGKDLEYSTQMSENRGTRKYKISTKINYAVYDRIRRRVILTK